MNILLDIKHNMHKRGYTFFKNEREYLSKNEVLCVKMDIDLALNNSLGFAFVILCESLICKQTWRGLFCCQCLKFWRQEQYLLLG